MQNSIRILFHWFTRCKSSVQVCRSTGVEAPQYQFQFHLQFKEVYRREREGNSIHLSIYLSKVSNWMGLSGMASAVAIKSQMYELMFLSIIKCYGLFDSLSVYLSVCCVCPIFHTPASACRLLTTKPSNLCLRFIFSASLWIFEQATPPNGAESHSHSFAHSLIHSSIQPVLAAQLRSRPSPAREGRKPGKKEPGGKANGVRSTTCPNAFRKLKTVATTSWSFVIVFSAIIKACNGQNIRLPQHAASARHNSCVASH